MFTLTVQFLLFLSTINQFHAASLIPSTWNINGSLLERIIKTQTGSQLIDIIERVEQNKDFPNLDDMALFLPFFYHVALEHYATFPNTDRFEGEMIWMMKQMIHQLIIHKLETISNALWQRFTFIYFRLFINTKSYFRLFHYVQMKLHYLQSMEPTFTLNTVRTIFHALGENKQNNTTYEVSDAVWNVIDYATSRRIVFDEPIYKQMMYLFAKYRDYYHSTLLLIVLEAKEKWIDDAVFLNNFIFSFHGANQDGFHSILSRLQNSPKVLAMFIDKVMKQCNFATTIITKSIWNVLFVRNPDLINGLMRVYTTNATRFIEPALILLVTRRVNISEHPETFNYLMNMATFFFTGATCSGLSFVYN